MNNRIRIYITVLVLLNTTLFFAQQESAKIPRVEIAGSQLIHINSEIVGQEYDLYVNLPKNYNDANKKFPVLFLLDAQWDFPLMQSLYGEQYYDGLVPDLVIVGITWGGNNPNYDLLRRRDFTPTAGQTTDNSGNASKFLEFIKKELIPIVESTYRVTDDRALAGSSLGGLFTLYTMFSETGLFKRYILTSPALQWENGILNTIEKSFSEKNSKIDARLYMAVGGYEYVPMLQNFYELLKKRNYENLEIDYNVIEGIGHSGSKADGYTRGLIFAYARPEVSLDVSVLEQYVGVYEIYPGVNVKISVEDERLVALTPDNFKITMLAETEKDFYIKGQYLFIHFTKDDNNKVTGFQLERFEGVQSAKKLAD